MQRRTTTVFASLAVVALLTGCGQGDSKDPAAAHGKAPGAGPVLVDQSLPAWHPVLPEEHPSLPGLGFALPEGHPPIPGDACPASGRRGFGGMRIPGPAEPEAIST